MQTQFPAPLNEFPFAVMGTSTAADVQYAYTLSVFFLNFAMQRANGTCLSLPVSRKSPAPSFQGFIETRYLPYVRTRKRSFATDERLLRQHVYPTFGATLIDAMTAESIEAWKVAFKEKGYSTSSVNRVLAVIKYALECAVSWSMIESNPAKGVPNFPLLASNPKSRRPSLIKIN